MLHLILVWLQANIVHAQMILPGGLMDSVPSIGADAAAGAASGSILPGLGTIIGGIGGVAGGLLGMIGGQNQNAANSANQLQAEAYNTEMSDTVYQRTVADMKAAGINPMFLAMGASTNSSPTAPMYTATNTLDQFANNASSIGDLMGDYLKNVGTTKDNQIKAAAANVAEPSAQADLATAQANQQKAEAAANVATATQQNDIDSSTAEASKSQSEAISAGADAKWANTDHWMKAIGSGANSAEKVLEGVGIGKFLKNVLPGDKAPGYRINPKTTGTFDRTTGEIHD